VRVAAPGKLVLTGAYAVREGAPAIVVAVDRYAIVDVGPPGRVDVRPLYDRGGQKLGLGSSAAAAVAVLGAGAAVRGEDVRLAPVRAALFREARAVHDREQPGGSGVDIAASVYGGALRYVVRGGEATVRAVELPAGLVMRAFWSGTSARTSDLLARVDATRGSGGAGEALSALGELAVEAADAIDAGDAVRFVGGAGSFGRALEHLGREADAPIVPPAFAELARVAAQERAAFLPSGAGGGDMGVWLGVAGPSDAFAGAAERLGLHPVDLAVDRGGVRVLSS